VRPSKKMQCRLGNSAEEKNLGVLIHTNLEKRQSSRVLQLQAVLSKRL
jgi:hypothetical protein